MTPSPMLIGLATLVLFIFTVVIVLGITYTKERLDSAKLKEVLSSKEASILQQQENAKQQKSIVFLNKIIEGLSYAGWYTINYSIFLLIVLFSALLFVLLFYYTFSNILAVFIGAVIGGAIPFYIMNMVIFSRTRKFNEALSEAMSVIVRMMRNGVGFEVALKRAVEISQSPLFHSLFKQFLAEKDLITEKKAFENMYKKVRSAEIKIFGLAIGIGKSSGGKFSNTLEKLESSIKQRVTLQRKVTVATREAKVGSFMIVGLLVFIFFILDSNFNGKIIEHFFHSAQGKMEILFVFMWVGIGLFINEKLTKVKA